MRMLIRKAIGYTWKPFLQWYLKKPRSWSREGLQINVLPGVFHPGFFFSTTFLLKHVKARKLENKKVLEIGSGSGFLSVYAARMKALVVSCDLNPQAVTCTEANFRRNNLEAESIVRSDLFMNLEPAMFDLILVNPPYYRRAVRNMPDAAWNAGVEYEYFKRLFKDLPSWLDKTGECIMVLSEGCDCDEILHFSQENGLSGELLETSSFFLEKHFIYRFTHSVRMKIHPEFA